MKISGHMVLGPVYPKVKMTQVFRSLSSNDFNGEVVSKLDLFDGSGTSRHKSVTSLGMLRCLKGAG